MVEIVEDTEGKIRDRPIHPKLRAVLEAAGNAAGIDTIRIVSGGQAKIGTPGKRTGSTRHDEGYAADLFLKQGGKTLHFTDTSAAPAIITFITEAGARGAIGMGAGVGYMDPNEMHIGFGMTRQDKVRVVWGKGEKSATAPSWLKAAAKAGWARLGGD